MRSSLILAVLNGLIVLCALVALVYLLIRRNGQIPAEVWFGFVIGILSFGSYAIKFLFAWLAESAKSQRETLKVPPARGSPR